MYLSSVSSNYKAYQNCINSDCSTSINTTTDPQKRATNSNVLFLNSKRKRQTNQDIFEVLSTSSTYSTKGLQCFDNVNDISFEEQNNKCKEEEQVNMLRTGLLNANFSTFHIFDKNKKPIYKKIV